MTNDIFPQSTEHQVPGTNPFVYIIILTWNGRDDTLECLRSLSALSYPNYRVLVVDNNSEDGTAVTVVKEFPGTELIVNNSNLRFAGGNNVGIRRAIERGAEYVMLLNNDTTVDRGFLTAMVEAMKNDAAAGIAGPKIYYFSDRKRIWYAGGKIEWARGWISHLGVRELDEGQFDVAGETGYVTGCCMLVKRKVIERIGMLDEAYYIYGEDADFCVRASRAGFRMLYVPSAVVWHKLSVAAGGHLSWFKNWNKLKSQLRLMGRYARPVHWLTIPFWTVANILAGLFRSTRAAKRNNRKERGG